MTIRIGTRGSDLAMWQARWVAERLETETEIVLIETRGDAISDVPLQTVEGSAFFTGEVDRALADGEVDLAVHSMKDLPVSADDGLAVAAIPARADAGERLLVHSAAHDPNAPGLPLAEGARVGTSSPRREAQVKALRPDLVCLPIRGNVPTRVDKLRRGDFDAILVAAAGLDRLGLDVSGLVAVDAGSVVPAPAQGALCVKARPGDGDLLALCEGRLHDAEAAEAANAERSVLLAAGGGCNLPVGAHARRDGDEGWTARICAWDETAQGAASTAAEAVDSAWARVSRAGLTIALTGSGEGPSKLAERLEALGAAVVLERVLSFDDLDGNAAAEGMPGAGKPDWVCATSRQAAARMAVPTHGVCVAAVGPSTAAALAERAIPVAFVGVGGAADLARHLPMKEGDVVLFPCAERHRPDLPRILEERGATVIRQPLYRTVPAPDAALTSGVDARLWLSPSSVEAAGHLDDGAPAYCLGAATKTALEAAGTPATLGLPPSSNGDMT